MAHHTKDKGDIGVTKVIADLTEKGFNVLIPVVSEHLPFDLVAFKNNKFIKIQVKYSKNGQLRNKRTWKTKDGVKTKIYLNDDFDYYALYLPKINVVCYPSIIFAGAGIRTTIPNSATAFYWYEDFLNLTDKAEKKTFHDFGKSISLKREKGIPNIKNRKVNRPSKKELEKLISEKPILQIGKQFGVSSNSVIKWAKQYGIDRPKRGYWNKVYSGKINN